MKHIKDYPKQERPIRILQFGGGVFLRGFFDWMLQKANDAGVYDGAVVIVRSRTHGADPLAAQNFNYTHVARDGANTDVTVVDSIAGSVDAAGDYAAFLRLAEIPTLETVVSNTTEAGIIYENCPRPTDACPESFPAKLTALLYHRFSVGGSGLLILPCELIERNGDILRDTVLRHAADWALGEDFAAWVNTACSFRNTLVDRIVSGAPTVGENPGLAWEDDLVNTSEYFHLFIIEGQEDARLPFARIGLNIKWVESVEAWRTVKVRILNGAHTSMIPYAMLLGIETVGDCLRDARTRAHLDACLVQILRSMDGDEAENRAYAAQVLTRFENPYIRHLCAAISLNSVSKFRVRVLQSILAYREKTGESPAHLLFALCMLIRFYREGNPNDSASVIETFRTRTVPELLADADIWGVSLTEYAEEVARYADTSL
ncbi:MAG: tagaturonate reductase [Clostridia bacterium]|nr:tagaturonate reductase [Clostridia bacterium]